MKLRSPKQPKDIDEVCLVPSVKIYLW